MKLSQTLPAFFFVVGLMACSAPQTSSVKTVKAFEISMRLEASDTSEEPWVWVGTQSGRQNLVICAGGECGSAGVIITALEFSESKSERSLYRSARPIAIAHLTKLTVAEAVGTGDLAQMSFNVLRRVRVNSTNPGHLPLLAPGAAGDFNLTLDDVYNQGNTSWCWGYSAFHTMKTYFNHLPPSQDSEIEAYRADITAVNSTGALRNILGKYRGQFDIGSPFQFLNIFRQEKSLPDKMGWANLHGPRDAVMNQVTQNLHKGIPAAYCYASHCVTIYGFHTDGQQITTLTIADSANSRRYSKSIEAIQSDFWAMWTLPNGQGLKGGNSMTGPFRTVSSEAIDPFEASENQ